MGPNVLLIVFDTARADAFEPYGAPPGASPTVQQIADRGQASEAFSTAPWTLPSHGAMFSGLLPATAGMPGPDPATMVDDTRAAVAPLDARWLPSVLSRNGYHTAGLSANGLVSSQTNFDQGFDEFHYIHSARWCHINSRSLYGRAVWTYRTLRARIDDGAGMAEQMLREWVADKGRRPFFWFVNLIECHSPYLPPRPYNPLSARQRLRAGREAGEYLMAGAQWRATLGGLDVPEESLRRMRTLYAAAVRSVDDWVARLLQSLDGHGLLDETIVVVTSDHGENIGEGGQMGHAFSLSDRLIKVPFVSSGPAAPVPDGLFSMVDLPGWIAQGCGIEDQPWEVPRQRSVAVAQFVSPGVPQDPRVPAIVEAWGLDEKAGRDLTETLACATNGRRKVLRRAGVDVLYDLESDPDELSPVSLNGHASGFDGEVAALRAALDEADAASVDRSDHGYGQSELSEEERAELLDRMRSLGYL